MKPRLKVGVSGKKACHINAAFKLVNRNKRVSVLSKPTGSDYYWR